MFAIPTIAIFFAFIYLRPHEVFPALHAISLPSILLSIILGLALDVRLGVTRFRPSVSLNLTAGFFSLCMLTLTIFAPDQMTKEAILLIASFVGFVVLSQALPTLRALGVIAGILLGVTLAICVIGVIQSQTPTVCIVRGASDITTAGEIFDGRPCVTLDTCMEGGAPGADYRCESYGPFETHTIEGRVRFRGVLEDPNELAMAIALAMPLAIGLYDRKRSKARLAFLLFALALGFTCTILTRSRSGQLALMAAVGAYFMSRLGRRGVVFAIVVSIPLFLLGGRSDANSESSTEERLECWAEALDMFRHHPFLGVGTGQFTQHHYLTAHNSFLLTVAELGPLGLFLWTAALYVAFKSMLAIQRDFADRPDAAVAVSWARALFASTAGLAVSTFFLSLAYHVVVWIFLGFVAALHGIVRQHAPQWRVTYSLRDVFTIAAIDLGLVGSIYMYVRAKGF
jgi:hypothetical protein